MKIARTFNEKPAALPTGLQRVFVRCTPDCPYDDCVVAVMQMPPPPPQPAPGEGKGQAKPEPKQEKPETKPEQPKDQPKPQPESKPDDGQAEAEPTDDGQAEPKPEPKPEPTPGPEQPAQQPQPVKIEYTTAPPPIEKLPEDHHGHGAGETPKIKHPPVPEEYEYLSDRVFQSKLRNIMLDNAFDRPIRGRKRGRLDMRSLYKVPAKAENIFTLKEARKNKKYNILLLVDESGSMSGRKAHVAAQAAVFLAQSFEGLNLDLAIVGFNEQITVRKDFGTTADYDKIYKKIASMNNGVGSGANNDWDALNKAYTMFKPGMKGENILIMLSDGQPASSRFPTFVNSKGKPEKPPAGSDHLEVYEKDSLLHLHHLVKANERKAKSIGIGIFQGGGQIPTHETINNLNDLKPAIIKQLAGRIKRG